MSTEFKFATNCPGLPPTIARDQVDQYFPWLKPSRMKNLDWQGNGPEGAFKIGKKIIYPTENLLEWLDSRMERPAKKPGKTAHGAQEKEVSSPRSRGRKRKEQEVKERRG